MSASKWKPYPEYKESNIPWISEMPSNWNEEKTKWVYNKMEREPKSNDEVVTCFRDGEVTLRKNRRAIGYTESNKEIGYQRVRKGDLVIHEMDGFAGAIGVSDSDGKCTPVYSILTAKGDVNPVYHSYVFREMAKRKWIAALSKGIRQRSTEFRYATSSEQLLPMPSKLEQAQISVFLEHKNTNLDRQISALNLQLKLLEEKRSALITQMVTNGLSNDTTNWKNTKIKYCLSMKGRLGWQGLKADEYQNTGPYVVSSAHFSNYKIRWEECPRVSLERYLTDENIQLREGDVLLMKDGASLGKIAQVSNQPDLACLNSHLLLLRPNSSEILEKFVFYLLDSMHFQDYMLDQGKGSTFLGVSQESIGNYAFSLPDTNEQLRIVKYLDEKIRLIDEISDNLIDKIKKCKELCKSLIFAAVTGKIDVRSL